MPRKIGPGRPTVMICAIEILDLVFNLPLSVLRHGPLEGLRQAWSDSYLCQWRKLTCVMGTARASTETGDVLIRHIKLADYDGSLVHLEYYSALRQCTRELMFYAGSRPPPYPDAAKVLVDLLNLPHAPRDIRGYRAYLNGLVMSDELLAATEQALAPFAATGQPAAPSIAPANDDSDTP